MIEQDEPLPDPHAGDMDIEQIRELLSLTPMERLRRHARMAALVRVVREAGERHYGNRIRPDQKAR